MWNKFQKQSDCGHDLGFRGESYFINHWIHFLFWSGGPFPFFCYDLLKHLKFLLLAFVDVNSCWEFFTVSSSKCDEESNLIRELNSISLSLTKVFRCCVMKAVNLDRTFYGFTVTVLLTMWIPTLINISAFSFGLVHFSTSNVVKCHNYDENQSWKCLVLESGNK